MQLAQLPNLATKFEELKLILDLRTRANPHTYLGEVIRTAIDAKKISNGQILNRVYDMAVGNPEIMNTVVGQELTERILNLKNK